MVQKLAVLETLWGIVPLEMAPFILELVLLLSEGTLPYQPPWRLDAFPSAGIPWLCFACRRSTESRKPGGFCFVVVLFCFKSCHGEIN
jgi:hypothetical protein